MYKLFYVKKNYLFNIIDYFIDILLILLIMLFCLNKIEIFKYIIVITTFIYIIKYIIENKIEFTNRTKNYLNKIVIIKNKRNIYILYKKINFTYIFVIVIMIAFFTSYYFKLNLFKELVILFLLIIYEVTNIINKAKLNNLINNLDDTAIIDNIIEKNKFYNIIHVKTIKHIENNTFLIEKRNYIIHDNYTNREELINLFKKYK